MSITEQYIYTDNGVDSTGTSAADGGNFTFYGNNGGTYKGWFITFPTPISNVTEVDFSTIDGNVNNTTSSFSGRLRLRATTQESGDVTVSSDHIPANGSISCSSFPTITLSNETLTGVSILGRSQSSGANFSMPSIAEGSTTYNITVARYIEATMYTHLADLTWTSISGATNYTITKIEDSGSEETIASETTELSLTAPDLNPGSLYDFNLYSDLDLVTATTSVTESAPVVNTAIVTFLATRLSNDFSGLSTSSYNEIEAELPNVLDTGDEVVLSSGDAVFVANGDTLQQIEGKDILTPFEPTAGSGQTATITTLDGDSSTLTYDESSNEITSDSTAYSVGSHFTIGSYKVSISEI